MCYDKMQDWKNVHFVTSGNRANLEIPLSNGTTSRAGAKFVYKQYTDISPLEYFASALPLWPCIKSSKLQRYKSCVQYS